MKDSAVKATVLNVGHHGSNASSSIPFLNKVDAKISVISVGADNKYGHPTKPALARLAEIKTKIYRTDLDGSVVIHSNGKKVTVGTDNSRSEDGHWSDPIRTRPPWGYHIECHSCIARLIMGSASQVRTGFWEESHAPDSRPGQVPAHPWRRVPAGWH